MQVIDGKARLISDLFCDGLGVCIGHCPTGAIMIEEREAEEYDERKVEEHINSFHKHSTSGCPGAKIMDFRDAQESRLRQWPVQFMLVPPFVSFLNNTDLLIAADCVGFAYADFHEGLLKGKTLLVGCPKFDDVQIYKERLAQVFKQNNIKSVTYAHMEVPCCFGLVGIINQAILVSGKNIPFKEAIISIKGERIK